jgi:hypothetical protein
MLNCRLICTFLARSWVVIVPLTAAWLTMASLSGCNNQGKAQTPKWTSMVCIDTCGEGTGGGAANAMTSCGVASGQCSCSLAGDFFCGQCTTAAPAEQCVYCPSGTACSSDPCAGTCSQQSTANRCPASAPVGCGSDFCCPSDYPICCPDGQTCGVSSQACADAQNQSSGTGGDQQGSCILTQQLSKCTISSCFSPPSSGFYRTSDGATFNCVSVSDCSAAANSAIMHCG